jgi:hypothetical protein
MKPNFRNLFMKKFTRERVVPTISASILLRNFWKNPLGFDFLAVAREKQQRTRQAFLARIEELIDQVFLDSDIPHQHKRYETIGKLMFGMEDPSNGYFRVARDPGGTITDCGGD